VKELAFVDVHKLYDRWNMNQIADSKLFIPASPFRVEGNEVEFGIGRCDDGAEGQAQRSSVCAPLLFPVVSQPKMACELNTPRIPAAHAVAPTSASAKRFPMLILRR